MNLAHYALMKLDYTTSNLRHFGLHSSRSPIPVLALRRIAPRVRSFAPCGSLRATTHIVASGSPTLIRSHQLSQQCCGKA
jgi:hypothetical protein